MHKFGKEEIGLINKYLRKKISPYLIILYGSFAKGKARKDSDVDIAFLSDNKFSDYEIFMIGQGLADILGKDVDLVDLSRSSTVFQTQVISTGKVIYCSNEKKRMLFEMTVLKKYARLNEERQHILKKVMECGSVYE